MASIAIVAAMFGSREDDVKISIAVQHLSSVISAVVGALRL